MNEEPTKNLSRSFEDRVFARFDAIDARLEKLESRSYDTKPIWQRALKAIMETSLEVGEVKKKVVVIEAAVAGLATDVGVLKADVEILKIDVGVLKTDVAVLKIDVGVLKTDVAVLKTDVGVLKTNVTEIKYELKEFKREVTKRLDEVQLTSLDNRVNIRDAHDRIDKLERRLE